MTRRPIRIVVSGCLGRMGALIVEEASQNGEHFKLMGGVEHEGHPQIGQPLVGHPDLKVETNLKSFLAKADLLIEFTTPEASVLHARLAADARVPMLIGTTGFSRDQIEELRNLSKKIPIFWSPNMSIGIVIVRKTITRICELLRNFELEEVTKVKLSETHHIRKKDRPSGTAKQLAEDVRKACGVAVRDEDIESKREGDVIGLHSVSFQWGLEQIVLQHEANDRRVFAKGALLVARNLHKIWKEPGWYTMDDFVNALQKLRIA